MTSHDVVSRMRRILKEKSIGHAGTLDPLASGLMVMLVGEATKISQYILEKNKAYKVGVKLGQTTDTLDTTGTILTESEVQCTETQVKETGLSIQGTFELPIPMYSAKKVDGKKLYELAREGVTIEIPTKEMSFWDVEYHGFKNDLYWFELRCSKGSFIRTWVSVLGEKLGCGATMGALVRTESEPYSLKQAITLGELKEMTENSQEPNFSKFDFFKNLYTALSSYKSIRTSDFSVRMLKNGQISHELRSLLIIHFDPQVDTFIKIIPTHSEQVLGLIGFEKDKGFVIKRVFSIDPY